MLNLSSESRHFDLNGKRLACTVSISIEPENDSPEGDFDFGNEAENAAYLARFKSGELQLVAITVTASFMGIEGVDHLGMCHVSSNTTDDDALAVVNDYGMIDNAIADLQRTLGSISSALEVANV